MTLVAPVLATVAACIALWIRRHTWRIAWEFAATLNVALQGAKILLVAPPVADAISGPLHRLTGAWNVEDLLAHFCYLSGMLAVVYMVLTRLRLTPTQRRRRMLAFIEMPATIMFPALAALFVWGGAGDADVPDVVLLNPIPPAMFGYWSLLVLWVAYMLGVIIWALTLLRRDPRQQRVADCYLGAAMVSAVGCLVAIIAFINNDAVIVLWVLVRIELAAYAAAAAYAWQRKVAAQHEARPWPMPIAD